MRRHGQSHLRGHAHRRVLEHDEDLGVEGVGEEVGVGLHPQAGGAVGPLELKLRLDWPLPAIALGRLEVLQDRKNIINDSLAN